MEFTQEQKMYGEIVQKAWEDAQFMSELMASPVAAIEKLTGQKLNLPEGKTLVVRDQTDQSTVYINLPAKPNTEDLELNEEQLEAVAGGTLTTAIIVSLPFHIPPTSPTTSLPPAND
ncbi:NHLP leader peptide family natural product precursor [Rudanella paleaurantiibacter]|uniref:NHLP leader peptide family natural product n=1 Tax=Rudanella paleaurantiibacter TaxID=2614655 RepID=A0A7J5TRZ3_9BACT|nr:NHLP leader peptide family RiPP precursor [Rudanella paleaurantiibacter]KAB7725719.1 NHLP leader peptide family natural product precursor [Rudanella paleaurantiibacter]